MIKQKFAKSFDDARTQAYLFHSELVVDQTAFTATSPIFASPFAADFLDDIEAAGAIPTNENDLNMQTYHTSEVEAQMVLARNHYQKLLFYIGMAWPDSDAILKVFGSNLYTKARNVPLKMMNLLQSAYSSANSVTYKSTLISAGFIQNDITLLDTLFNDLTEKINIQQDFIKHSYVRSEERAIAYNKIWDSMVKISNASKLIFKDSPAKIEFYLLYPSNGGGGSLTAPVNLAYNYSSNTFTWDIVTNATSYQMEISSNGADWMEIYADSASSFVYIPESGAIKYYRVRARNSNGYGSFGSILNVTYYDSLSKPSNLTIGLSGSSAPLIISVNWNSVAGATRYKIFRSIVNVGSSAGTYSYMELASTNTFSEESIENKRFYYYIVAVNDYLESTACSAVFVDVPVNPA
ncbi:MAG: hypothetical protein NT007_08545 [Candidatus Kapabacteria bacterium]|nr:hypothetical protein [Candidatus Kapabacteria bacterium]